MQQWLTFMRARGLVIICQTLVGAATYLEMLVGRTDRRAGSAELAGRGAKEYHMKHIRNFFNPSQFISQFISITNVMFSYLFS